MSDVTVLEKGPRQARKQHRCEFCSARIEPGERYIYYRALVDNRAYFASGSRCMACYERLGR